MLCRTFRQIQKKKKKLFSPPTFAEIYLKSIEKIQKNIYKNVKFMVEYVNDLHEFIPKYQNDWTTEGEHV